MSYDSYDWYVDKVVPALNKIIDADKHNMWDSAFETNMRGAFISGIGHGYIPTEMKIKMLHWLLGYDVGDVETKDLVSAFFNEINEYNDASIVQLKYKSLGDIVTVDYGAAIEPV